MFLIKMQACIFYSFISCRSKPTVAGSGKKTVCSGISGISRIQLNTVVEKFGRDCIRVYQTASCVTRQDGDRSTGLTKGLTTTVTMATVK